MVRAAIPFVAIAVGASSCQAFVPPAASTRLAVHSQAPRLTVSTRSHGSLALQRARDSRSASTRFRVRQLGLQMQQDDGRMASGGFNLSGEAPFEIRGFSLANLALLIGVGITGASFFEYFTSGGSGGLSGIGFVYGIPISLIGLALKYAELEPAPLESTPEADALFEQKATGTMRAIKNDVTRHRYGDEAHLDTTVKFLGLVMQRGDYPQLQYIKQSVEPNGELGFTMVWQSKDTPFKKWIEPERIDKYVTFFGPGVDAEVIKVNAEERMVAIKLTTLPPGVQPTPKAAKPAEAKKESKAPAAEAVAAAPASGSDEAAATSKDS